MCTSVRIELPIQHRARRKAAGLRPVTVWKPIVAERITALDEDAARLRRSSPLTVLLVPTLADSLASRMGTARSNFHAKHVGALR